MSGRAETESPEVEGPVWPSAWWEVSATEGGSSCLSSEMSVNWPSSPEADTGATAMLLVGCPRCLMYVMLWEASKCPMCNSTVLLDFLKEERDDQSPQKKDRN